MPISSRLGSCHSSVCRSISIVRLALVTSVACTPPRLPPVRFQSTHVSMFPNASSPPRRARAHRVRCRASTRSWAREVGRQRQPDLPRAGGPAPPRPPARAPARSVRVSCQTIALCIGSPVSRSQTDGRLALVGDADRGDLARLGVRARQRAADHLACAPPDLRARRARPSRRAGGSARARAGRTAAIRPSRSNRISRVLVVPWSIAAT